MAYVRLHVTSSCNLECYYCHVKNYAGKNEFMHFEDIDYYMSSIIDVLKEEGQKELTLSFYGGEPFLNKNNVFATIQKYGNFYKGVDIYYIINTNGTLLQERDVEILKRFNVDVHISIDGPESVHNKVRKDKGGNPTYGSSKRTLDIAQRNGLNRQINTYVMPENIKHLQGLIDEAKKYGVGRIYLDWIYTKDEIMNPVYVVHNYLKVLKYAESKGIEVNGPWKKVWGRLKNESSKNLQREQLINSIEITPSGDCFFGIFPLTRKRPFKISQLNQIMNSDMGEKFLNSCRKYFRRICGDCNLYPYCFGDAIMQYMYHTLDNSNFFTICELTRKLLANLTINNAEVTKPSTVQVNITYDCNKNCHYCYVKDFLNHGSQMSIQYFHILLNWLEKNNIKSINLTGGEPSTHPNLKEFIDLCNRRDFAVNIFTNGVFQVDLLKKFDKVNSFLVNINEHKDYSVKEIELFRKNLREITKKSKLSLMFCIKKETDSCEHIIQACQNYDVDKVFIDLTQPNSFSSNYYILNEEIKELKEKLLRFIEKLASHYIRVELARPLPYCVFTNDELKYLAFGHNFRGICHPGSDIISINPDLTVYPCLSLFIKGPKITDFSSTEEYVNYYERCIEELKWERSLYDDCKHCVRFKKRECQGGCLCRKTKEFKVFSAEEFTLYTQLPEDKNFEKMLKKTFRVLDEYFGDIKPVEVYRFDNKGDMRMFSNTYKYPHWATAFSSNNIYYQKGSISQRRLIHEICHLYISQKANTPIPSWFNEGLCEYIAYGREVNERLVSLLKYKKLIPFKNMTGIYKNSLLEFDNSPPENNIAYTQSASLVGFMINNQGFAIISRLLTTSDNFYKTMEREMDSTFANLVDNWEQMFS